MIQLNLVNDSIQFDLFKFMIQLNLVNVVNDSDILYFIFVSLNTCENYENVTSMFRCNNSKVGQEFQEDKYQKPNVGNQVQETKLN